MSSLAIFPCSQKMSTWWGISGIFAGLKLWTYCQVSQSTIISQKSQLSDTLFRGSLVSSLSRFILWESRRGWERGWGLNAVFCFGQMSPLLSLLRANKTRNLEKSGGGGRRRREKKTLFHLNLKIYCSGFSQNPPWPPSSELNNKCSEKRATDELWPTDAVSSFDLFLIFNWWFVIAPLQCCARQIYSLLDVNDGFLIVWAILEHLLQEEKGGPYFIVKHSYAC